jgi:hypothetical protein
MRAHLVKDIVSVISSTDDQSSVNLSKVVTDHLTSQREFNTSEDIVSCLHVVKVDVSNSLSNGSVSVIFPSNEVIKVCSDWRVLPVRV